MKALSWGRSRHRLDADCAENKATPHVVVRPKGASMIHHVIARFPEHAEAIESLNQTNPGFEELCHRYGHVVERLLGLGAAAKTELLPEATDLRKRRVALEEELMLAINSNRV